MIKLPQKTIWNQNNLSDRFGDLWSSYNLDLTSKLGAMRVSPRLLLNLNSNSSGGDTNLGIPCAARFFVAGGFTYWAICGSYLYHSTSGLDTTFAKDATASTPTDCNSDLSDMEILPDLGYLLVSRANTTVSFLKTDGTWNSCSSTLFDNAGCKAMTYFRGLNKIFIVDDSAKSISSISNAATPAITKAAASTAFTILKLVDGTINKISWIKSTSTRVWIGTINFSGESGRVYAWDGNTGAGGNYVPNEVYRIDASGSYSCVIENDVPVILDTKGRLLKLNGGTFQPLDSLPFQERLPLTIYVGDSVTQRLCHYNGMDIINGKINLLIRGTLYENGNYNKENLPSGIWEYTKETGLYHKASVGQTTAAGTIADYGQQKVLAVGCLVNLDTPLGVLGVVNGSYIAGVDYYSNATTDYKGLFYNDRADTLQKAGYFVTSKIFSQNITDTWARIYLRFKRFLSATDKVVMKCRTTEIEPIGSEFTITWTSTTSFTTSQNIVGYEGYEIEILQGVGAGRCAHLVTTGYNATNYIATTDETITGATGTAIARLQNWKKLGSYSAQTEDFAQWSIDTGNSTWIQFKVWFLSTGKNEINDCFIINKEAQGAK